LLAELARIRNLTKKIKPVYQKSTNALSAPALCGSSAMGRCDKQNYQSLKSLQLFFICGILVMITHCPIAKTQN
jgi:hypothetical protein